ncbi:MAG: serine/threonine protein kinase [Atopobiaceae bacterium]|nr:serine/threonine protein kinase [Atopobiaceae bacterium]
MPGPELGRMIDGKYELIAPIGKGGMSVVWLGRDLRLDKLWAVKEIRPDGRGKSRATSRRALIDEANFIKRLDHPAIPRVVDMVEDGGSCFVVMDYVDGRPLSQVLRERSVPFEQDDVVGWGIQLCDVLGYLHARTPPVVYRDLKPSNVMLRDDGSLKLVDFGIADELLPGRGGDGRCIGSPGYSAPEQVDRKVHEATPTDARADVYALGATLFSLVTGIVPTRVGPLGSDVAIKFDLVPIRQVNPALSDGLEQVIVRATMHDPRDRYQSVAEMRYDLEHYEELTQQYRSNLQRKVRVFARWVRASVAACLMGVALVVGSVMVRNSSYDAIMHRAGISDASAAQEAYAQAIGVAPSRAEAYEGLLNAFKSDGVLSTDESDLWMRIWQEHGREVEGDSLGARVCYDAGVLYLCYFDAQSTWSEKGEDVKRATGDAAMQRVSRAVPWFERSVRACDPAAGNYAGLVVDEHLDEYAASEVYLTVGEFYTRLSRAYDEGGDVTDVFQSFWNALEACVVGTGEEPALLSRAEPIVCLRLYQVAFDSIASSTYLSGFMHAGVTKQEALRLLDAAKEGADSLEEFSRANAVAAGALFDELELGYEVALDNVSRTFGNPVASMQALIGGVGR